MIKLGITGQSGFIGTHLARAIEKEDDIELIPFDDSFFDDDYKLSTFVRQCDAIMHLAAMSRGPSEDELYKTNIGLVNKLINAIEVEKVKPHVLFSSSTHEIRDTAYGRAKRDGRILFTEWAQKNDAAFTGFIFPNVYGPGAKVHYASFIANFAWELNHDMEPKILVDAPIKLIYVNNLIDIIIKQIYKVAIERVSNNSSLISCIEVPHDFEKLVTEILSIFKDFKLNGYTRSDADLINLYNTYISYK